jgi:hypothetical protein
MRKIIIATGLATFFFGFGAGAILNFYLIWIDSPLVKELRGSLTFISSIIGDGILLPITNMIVVSFLLQNKKIITKALVYGAFLMGGLITTWFHVTQAMSGLVNWTMPEPWKWNILGVWHGVYMLAVCTLLSLFLLTVIQFVRKEKRVPKEAVLVALGVLIFLILLRLDYSAVSLNSLLP